MLYYRQDLKRASPLIKKKAKEICHYSKKIICIFRPEYEFYKNLHPQTYYFGHPYTDIIDNSYNNNNGTANPI